MSQHSIPSDDPRLTAYALGELDPTEQQEVERLLAESADARSAVKEIRELAGLLTAELKHEPAPALTATQRAAILDAGARPQEAASTNGAVSEQRVAALATRYHSVAQFQSQHSPRVRRIAAFAAVAALVAIMVLLMTPPRSGRLTLIADNSTTPRHSPFGFSPPDAFDADVAWQANPTEEMESLGTSLSQDAAQSASSRPEQLHERFGNAPADEYARPGGARGLKLKDQPSRAKAGGYGGGGGGGMGGGIGGRTSGVNYKGNASGAAGKPADGEGGEVDYSRDGQKVSSTLSKSERGRGLAMPQSGDGAQPEKPAIRNPIAETKPRSASRASDSAPVTSSPLPASRSRRYAESKSGGEAAGQAEGQPSVKRALAGENRGDGRDASGKQLPELRHKQLADDDAKRGEGKGAGDLMLFAKDRLSNEEYYNKLREGAPDARDKEAGKKINKGLSNTFGQPLPPFGNGQTFESGLSRLQGGASDGFGMSLGVQDSILFREHSEGLGAEAYAPLVENSFLSAYEDPLSTFGADVDTASYANVRRFLTNHQLPPRDAVRIEELVNYFSYDYPQPAAEQPFSVSVDAANCPWNPGNKLVRIGLKGREIPRDKRPPSNLVFLVDVSGSMQSEEKLPLVKMGLNLLTNQITEADRVAIVTYSDTAVQRLESTDGGRKPEIRAVIDSLQAAGSTNGAEGIQLAYRAAIDHFIPGGTNRVILCTDGDFNVGVTSDEQLVQLIQERSRTKVFFSVLGFGMGNLKDGKLEKLADKGNGQYAYIDGQKEAQKVFVDDLVGTLVTIAKDVKLQVEFNPNQVNSYRLIGYENRVMPAADFNNDQKDAGDVGAGHSVTALYEVVPAGEAPKPILGDALRYRKAVVPQEGALAQELLTVKLRYKLPEADASTLVEYPVSSPANIATVADGRNPVAFYSVQLNRLDAAPAADKLRELFEQDKKEAPVIEADKANRRLLFRGTAEQVSQGQTLLARLGETGSARDFNWAAAVAAFGLLLRDSQYRGQASLDMVLELATAAKGEDPTGRRQDFIDLVKHTKEIAARRSDAGAVELLGRMTREQREALASVDGKYKNLLRIVEAPADMSTYSATHDFGRWEGTTYSGQSNLPKGYWVYIYPNWYIWGDVAK
ncbi:MAG: von Willebrand factor type A domain-containing protein [Planctomycetia bacterium]|nr:von Willebrand factor type A domain-containing protein [Planctomycetia bacterium]